MDGKFNSTLSVYLTLILFVGGLVQPAVSEQLHPLTAEEMSSLTAGEGFDLAFKINLNSSGSNPSDANWPGAHLAWRDDDNVTGTDACPNSWDCDDAFGIFDELYAHVYWDKFIVDAASTGAGDDFLQLRMADSGQVDGYLQSDAIGIGDNTDMGCDVTGSCGNTIAGNVVMEGPFDIDGTMRVWGDG